ncbi:MAG: hypothetical protein OEM52_09665 [bacterium]|nr:hypothetical protein [bacterium]
MSSSTIPGKQILRALEMEGYLTRASSGKHVIIAGTSGGNLIVLKPGGDVPRMYIRYILDASGISRERFFANVAKSKLEPRRRYTLLSTIFAKPQPESETSSRHRIAPIAPTNTAGKNVNHRKP